MQPWALAIVIILVCVGMLAIVPLGLRLAGPVPWWWFAGAVPGAVSLLLPRGWAAFGLATCYVAATVALAATRGWVALRIEGVRRIALLTAFLSPVVASVSLAAERIGYPLMNFDLTTLRLTVAHFHFAGFAAALIAGLVSRLDHTPLGTVAALAVPAGTGIVLIGYFTNDWVELAGAVVLTGGMWLTGWLTWRHARPLTRNRWARTLLAVSAVVLAATMVLALLWALGEATGIAHPTLEWMVATHGLANALGFALCGLLAWQTLVKEHPRILL